ncbi:MAG: hypothetical protein KGL70_00590, partial [Betaproteobacteria bacterium]|nr:hypothetical protein [Betaproteobacteria bacterium]
MFTNELPFRTLRSWVTLFAAAWLLVIAGAARAQSTPQQLVDESATTLSHFMRDPDMTWLQR